MNRTQRRPYRLQRRRESMDETRDRIARAAFELHGTVGPAHATISAIAERAGVQRHTVYRHFPDIVTLIRACTVHGMSVTGLPQPERWEGIDDGHVRLRVALEDMYQAAVAIPQHLDFDMTRSQDHLLDVDLVVPK